MKYILAYNYVGAMFGIGIVIGDEHTVVDYITSRLTVNGHCLGDDNIVFSIDDLDEWISDNIDEIDDRCPIFTITDFTGEVLTKVGYL